MSNEKTIDERISELPDDVKSTKLPEEGLPKEFEKFAGKPITEVLKVALESQANYTKGQQDKATAERLVEELTGSKQTLEKTLKELQEKSTPEPEPEPESDDEYEYMTKGEFKKLMAELNKPKEDGEKPLTQAQVVETVKMQTTIDRFSEKHPELDEADLNSIIQFGIAKGAKNLNEAFDLYSDLAKKLGYDKEGKSETHIIPSQQEGHEKESEANRTRFSDIVSSANKSRLGSMITPVKG